ncbi:MAG: hypothetical protein F9K43_07535 [Bauldia sp.]|nr:MAG: hypothetical protein F9K43_07535 [Bauldia sp.]
MAQAVLASNMIPAPVHGTAPPKAFREWRTAMVADGWTFVKVPGGFYYGFELWRVPPSPSP